VIKYNLYFPGKIKTKFLRNYAEIEKLLSKPKSFFPTKTIG
jgi:hypothetical protein